MKVVSNMKRGISKAITKVSEKTAVNSLNSACFAWQYQPKQPSALKKNSK